MLQELRKPKVKIIGANVALFDLSLTMAAGYYVADKFGYNKYLGALMMIPLGFVVHELVGVKTPLNEAIKKKIEPP